MPERIVANSGFDVLWWVFCVGYYLNLFQFCIFTLMIVQKMHFRSRKDYLIFSPFPVLVKMASVRLSSDLILLPPPECIKTNHLFAAILFLQCTGEAVCFQDDSCQGREPRCLFLRDQVDDSSQMQQHLAFLTDMARNREEGFSNESHNVSTKLCEGLWDAGRS